MIKARLDVVETLQNASKVGRNMRVRAKIYDGLLRIYRAFLSRILRLQEGKWHLKKAGSYCIVRNLAAPDTLDEREGMPKEQ